MAKNNSIAHGDHLDGFIARQMVEDNKTKIAMLRRLLEDGEKSGPAEYSYEDLMNKLDEEFG